MVHCPSCASGLRFDIESQKLVCEHCGNSFAVEDVKDSQKDDATESNYLDAYAFICPSCAAEIVTFDENDAVGFCPYCGGESMLRERIRKKWAPKSVIPFKITKEQCKKEYIKEVKRHPFVSSKYRKPELIDSFRGLYMPYWHFDGKIQGHYTVKNLKTAQEGIKTTTYITYDQDYLIDYNLSGYSHDASLKFDDHVSEKLAPYHGEDEVDFHPGYLSGFYAEIGDADLNEYKDVAASALNEYTQDRIEEKISAVNYRNKRDISLPTKVKNIEYSLHPVWFMSYRRKKKMTYAAVNGQTGKVAADLPLSPLRILAAALILAAAIFGLLFLGRYTLPTIKANATLGVCAMLLLTGLYFFHDTYLYTLKNSLNSPIVLHRIKSNRLVAGILSALSVIFLLMIANDGSYAQGAARFAKVFLFIVMAVFIGGFHVKQCKVSYKMNSALSTHTVSSLRTGLIEIAKKYYPVFTILRVIGYISVVVFSIMALTDNLSKSTYYTLCGIAAAEMIAWALVYIRVQTNMSMRRPPQMDKKGAVSDES